MKIQTILAFTLGFSGVFATPLPYDVRRSDESNDTTDLAQDSVEFAVPTLPPAGAYVLPRATKKKTSKKATSAPQTQATQPATSVKATATSNSKGPSTSSKDASATSSKPSATTSSKAVVSSSSKVPVTTSSKEVISSSSKLPATTSSKPVISSSSEALATTSSKAVVSSSSKATASGSTTKSGSSATTLVSKTSSPSSSSTSSTSPSATASACALKGKNGKRGDDCDAQGIPTLERIKKELTKVGADNCLFYSGPNGYQQKATAWRNKEGRRTYRTLPQMWADQDWRDPYVKTPENAAVFNDRASQAMAELCSGVVYVMLPTDTKGTEWKTGTVWDRMEYPNLSSKVTKLIRINPENDDEEEIAVRK